MSEFLRFGRETFDQWNNNWGRTEYTTAIGQAQMASKWNEIGALYSRYRRHGTSGQSWIF